MAMSWRSHVHAGQNGECSIKHRFQFYTLSSALVDSDFCTQMHHNSNMHYNGASRLWTARLLRQAQGDVLAQEELLFQLPIVPEPVDDCSPWDEDEREDILKHALKYQPLLRLLDSVINYERLGPIQVCPNLHWDA